MNTKYDKLITQHKLKLHFFFFLKKIKQSITHKIFLINIYFFIRNNSFTRFMSILKLKIKRKLLKQKLKQMRVMRFFNKTKELINSIKNPNGKITSVHAYLFYFQSLKQRILQGLKINIKRNKMLNRTTVSLYSVRAKMAMTVFFSQIKKFYYLKDLPLKEKAFNQLIMVKVLRAYTKRETENNEKYRLIRRFVYINTVKYALGHIAKKGLKMSIKENQIDNSFKALMLRVGVKILRRNISTILKLKKKKEAQHCLAQKHFIKRMKYRINNKHLIQKNIQILIKKIISVENKKTMLLLHDLYQDAKYKQENRNKMLMRKIALRAIRAFASINKSLHLKVNQLQKKIRINKLKYFNELIATIRDEIIGIKKKEIGHKHILNKAKVKLLTALKSIVITNQSRRTKIALCANHSAFKLKEQLFSRLILNRTIQIEKKKEYNQITQMRSEIISKKLFQHLLVTYSKQINQKEDYISNQLITKRSRGLRAAFLWLNKLKALVLLRKKHGITNVSLEKAISHNVVQEIVPQYSIPKHKQQEKELSTADKLIDDLNQLKQLRNKKRIAPQKLGFDSIK